MGGTLAPTNPPGGIAGTGIGLVQALGLGGSGSDVALPKRLVALLLLLLLLLLLTKRRVV